MVLVLTGATAINVEYKTIQSALKIPTYFKWFTLLRNEAAISLQISVDPVSFLIINEFSMIGCHLIAALEQRYLEGKPDSSAFFEGLFVYLI